MEKALGIDIGLGLCDICDVASSGFSSSIIEVDVSFFSSVNISEPPVETCDPLEPPDPAFAEAVLCNGGGFGRNS